MSLFIYLVLESYPEYIQQQQLLLLLPPLPLPLPLPLLPLLLLNSKNNKINVYKHTTATNEF